MRQSLIALTMFVAGGCSLIYDPDNIHKHEDARALDAQDSFDADSEVIVDANPTLVRLDSVYPPFVDEGTGMFGSRPAILELLGENFVKDTADLVVTIAPSTAATIVDMKVASDHRHIVLALQIPIDATCAPPGKTPISVTVTQEDGTGGTAMTQMTNAFAVNCLRELTANVESSALDANYSTIELAAAITFTPQSTATQAAILRSTSHIVIAGAVTASASGASPGPGGGIGGAASTAGSGPGRGKPGLGGMTVGGGGGGAGFVIAGTAGMGNGVGNGLGGGVTGDQWIASYVSSQASGGGGGQTLGVSGGAGGGGGGTVELSASGDVSVAAITATGGASTISAGTGGAGGAAAGGVILLRSGATLSTGALTVLAGSALGNGGASSGGRIRIDAAAGTIQAGATIGPMFVGAPVVDTEYPTLNLRGTPNDQSSQLEVFDKAGNIVDNGHLYHPVFGASGTAMITPVLRVGYNHICVLVAGNVDATIQEGTNCIDLGYAP